MKAIVKLEHWHLFLILLSSALIPHINPLVDKIISFIYFSFFIFWMFSIVTVLNTDILQKDKPKTNYYNFTCTFFVAVFGVIIFTTDYGIYINNSNYQEFGIWLWPLLILMFYMLWSIAYIFYFTAKVISLSNIKLNNTSDSTTTNYFFAFWFYIIGLWFIQPKVAELLSKKEEDDFNRN